MTDINNIIRNIGLLAATNALDMAWNAMNSLQNDLKKAREAAKALLLASEVNREFDINSKDDFQEMYPDYVDYASGDIDELLLQAQEKVREMLKTTFDPDAQVKHDE